MSFSTSTFCFLFFPIFIGFYYLAQIRFRKYILLLASIIFYAWSDYRALVVIIFMGLLNFILGKIVSGSHKKLILSVGIIVNLLPLMVSKYINFFLDIVSELVNGTIPRLEVLVPIGVSYFSFSCISYLIDIYRGDVTCENNICNYVNYIIMFPKITAGPIIRYKDISDQFNCSNVSKDKIVVGVKEFIVGLSKKVLIADQLGCIADEIFLVPAGGNLRSVAWLGIICYSLQLYYDFSGYSDMAIGIARMLGFDFKINFDHPYISKSITEFWRRWHISLSTWFRDYLYIPLGGNRRGNVYVNTMIVFLTTGLWHGASWSYIAWGIWHGIFSILEKFCRNTLRIKVPTFVMRIYTLSVVCIGWIFFRCATLSDGLYYIKNLLISSENAAFTLGWYLSVKIIIVLIIAILFSVPINEKVLKKLKNSMVENVVHLMLFFCCIIMIMSSSYNSFIYFKF